MVREVSAASMWWGLVWLQGALARPDGLPWPDSCESLSPGNGIPPQPDPMPYKLLIDSNKVTSAECIYVTLKGYEGDIPGNDGEVNEFAGFMIQFRNESGVAVGRFLEADDVKLMDCFGQSENTAININYLPKEEITVRWYPDRGYNGVLRIYATVAKDYLENTYWLKQKSRRITVTKDKYFTK